MLYSMLSAPCAML